MPELLTKHPDVALKILKDAKIKCATDAKPKILTNCPKENFCSLPTGELCIYGIKDIPQMTQINALDVFFLPSSLIVFAAMFVLIFLLGMMAGIKIK